MENSFLIVIVILIETVILLMVSKHKSISESFINKENTQGVLIEDTSYIRRELVKQIIKLTKYEIIYRAPYNGYLYVRVEAGQIDIGKEDSVRINRKLERIYIERDTEIKIKPIGLKDVRFQKFELKDFIEDINRGKFKK